MTDCLFCKIIKKEIPSISIHEDDEIYAFLDINPVNLGHTLVVPKEHFRNLYETPDNVLAKLMAVAKKISVAEKEALPCEGINIEMNNDEAAGQIIFHTHIHVIPRFKDDGFKHWKGSNYSEERIKEAGEKIKDSLIRRV